MQLENVKPTQQALYKAIIVIFSVLILRLELAINQQNTRIDKIEDMVACSIKTNLNPLRMSDLEDTHLYQDEMRCKSKREKRSSDKKAFQTIEDRVSNMETWIKVRLSELERKLKQVVSIPGPIGPPGPSLAPPSVFISPSHLIVNKTKSAILQCSATGNPQPVIGWSKMGGSLPKYRSMTDNNGTLEIKNVSLRDSGVYQCEASNILGTTTTTAKIEVNYPPQVNITKGPVYRSLGKNVTLPTCHVTGHPKPKITWTRAIGQLPRDRTLTRNGDVTIVNSIQNDSGLYFCKAKNPLGSVTATTIVVFVNLPEFTVKPKPLYQVALGSDITIPCSAKGNPQPVINWVKNNGNLVSSRHTINQDGSLIIRKATQSDAGTYTCIVRGGFIVELTTSLRVITLPKGCSELYNSGERSNGVYTIKPDSHAAFKVYCDMTTDGGGWTVFQRRQDGSVPFDRNWHEYKTGFGNLTDEFWLGNDYIHRLTSRTWSSLRVDLEDFLGHKYFAKYGSFSVSSESDEYRLSINTYFGTAGKAFSSSNNKLFSTKDRDNGEWSDGSCSRHFSNSGWWLVECGPTNLNGRYILPGTPDSQGIHWNSIDSSYRSLRRTAMKIRPSNF